MSVASLENGNLTLNSLTINNSQYAEALGYVPSQTLILSSLNNTRIVNDEIVVGSTTGNNVVLTCNASNTLQVGATGVPGDITCAEITTPSIVVGSLTGNNVNLSSPIPNNLTLNAGSASSFTTSQINLGTAILSNPSTSSVAVSGDFSCQDITSGQTLTMGVGSSNIQLSCSSFNILNLGGGGSGTLIVGAIQLGGTGTGAGALTVNSSGQLLWNGVVIS